MHLRSYAYISEPLRFLCAVPNSTISNAANIGVGSRFREVRAAPYGCPACIPV